MMASLLTSWHDGALALVAEHIALAEPLVFLLGFAESIVFLSLLVPSSILFLAIGGLHSAAGGTFWPLWLAAAAGAFLGDIITYAVGRYFSADIAQTWPFRKKPEWYLMSRVFFAQWGFAGLLIGKFLGMMRPFLPVAAGAMHMPWPVFLIGSVVSSLMWAGVFLAPGYGLTFFWR